MKATKIICVRADSHAEQQFIITRFPQVCWNLVGAHSAHFYIDLRYEKEVYKEIEEWNRSNKK